MYVVLEMGLSAGVVGAALPGAGVSNVGVNNLNVPLPVTSLGEALLTMLTLESPYLLVDSLYVLVEILPHAELQATLITLVVVLLLLMNSLVMHSHVTLMSKPLHTLFTFVIHPLMNTLLVGRQASGMSIALKTSLYITLLS